MNDYTDRDPLTGRYLREPEVDEPTEDEWRGVYPGMCADPEICRGRSACPRDYSCCE